MAKARSASKVKSKIQMIFFGEPFTGKSTLASQFAYMKNANGEPFKVLYIDPESGSIDDYLEDLEENGVNLQNIYIVYTQSLAEVREYIQKAKDNENFHILDDDGYETDNIVVDANGNPFKPDAIVVDGVSILNLTTKQGLVEFSKKRASVKATRDGLIGDERVVKVEGAGLELKDYQTVNFKGQDLILDLTGSGKHYIVTAREVDEKRSVKTDSGQITSVATGKKIPEGFKEMDYNAKTVIRMYRDEEDYENVKAFVVKDRTGVHKAGEILVDPSLIDWQTVIDKTAKHDDYVINNNLQKAVEIEESKYTQEILGSDAFGSDEPSQSEEKELYEKINNKIRSLPPVKKTKAKNAVVSKNLPSDFSKADLSTLKQILEIVGNF